MHKESKQSSHNLSRHQYGPDGEEIFREVHYWQQAKAQHDVPSGKLVKERTVLVSDGPNLVLQYCLDSDTGWFFQLAPGLANRLSVRGLGASDPVWYYRV